MNAVADIPTSSVSRAATPQSRSRRFGRNPTDALRAATVATLAAIALPLPAPAPACADTAVWVDATRAAGAAAADFDFNALVPSGYDVDVVPYPGQTWPISGIDSHSAGYSAQIGVDLLIQTVSASLGRVFVFGGSLGALTIDHFLSNLPTNLPTPQQLSFAVMGDPYRGGILAAIPAGSYIPFLDLIKPGLPDTPYDVMVVQNQYDAIGDFPDRPNPVAVINAILGGILYHNGPAYTAALGQAQNGTLTPTSVVTNSLGGITTTYIAPHSLAITTVLTALGLPTATTDKLDALLKPLVEAGYSRNDPPTPVATAAAAVPAAQEQRAHHRSKTMASTPTVDAASDRTSQRRIRTGTSPANRPSPATNARK